MKWHLALLIPRLDLTDNEKEIAWQTLAERVLDKQQNKITRSNSIRALYEIAERDNFYLKEFELAVNQIRKENIPSLNARIKKLAGGISATRL